LLHPKLLVLLLYPVLQLKAHKLLLVVLVLVNELSVGLYKLVLLLQKWLRLPVNKPLVV
jgi:hypothetical protein